MRNERLLPLLVLADFVLSVASIAIEGILHGTLPGDLQAYVFESFGPPWSLSGLAVTVFWSVALGATITAWIGLLVRWRFAREIYLAAWGAMLAVVLLSGPSVMTAAGAVVETLAAIVSGILIGFVYFSDGKKLFVEQPEEGHYPTAAPRDYPIDGHLPLVMLPRSSRAR